MMIRALLIFSLIFPFLSHGRAESTLEFPPNAAVVQMKDDKSLGKNEAAFEFVFHRPEGGWGTEEIRFSVNKGKNRKIRPDAQGRYVFKTVPGTYRFQFYYTDKYFEVTSAPVSVLAGQAPQMDVHFPPSDFPIVVEKPVIYFYPEKKIDVTVTLNVDGILSFTYPDYGNGWKFTAEPDGSLRFEEKTYRYLFWDGIFDVKADEIDWDKGFVVKRKDLLSFLESRLSEMGFNAQETQDFITYWYPRMKAKVADSLYIHFLFNEDCNHYAKMTVDPAPDHVFRVYMIWSKTNPSAKIEGQILPRFNRAGFSILEWGGVEL